MNILTRSIILIESFKDANPSLLTDKQLLDYHRKCHMMYAGNVKHNPPNKSFLNLLITLHNRFVKEMQKRGMKHNTPLP
jgi:hypothetical protein